jgi:long-chain-acyl-CoA dehydrogenase
MSEPDVSGSDILGIKTRAEHDGSDWILNGTKAFVTNGLLADVIIVVAVTDHRAKNRENSLSMFFVDSSRPGLKRHKMEKIGFKEQDNALMSLTDVRVPATALLGQLNAGYHQLISVFPLAEFTILPTIAVAMSEFMYEETKAYVKQRRAFGKTISDLQVVQHKLAELKTEICIGRVFMDHVNMLKNLNQLDIQMAFMAKYWLAELQNRVATQCLQLHGGWGYMWEFPIAKAFVDSRVSSIYGSPSEVLKDLIAKRIVADT